MKGCVAASKRSTHRSGKASKDQKQRSFRHNGGAFDFDLGPIFNQIGNLHDSLIDYNFKRTVFSVGFSLLDF